MEKNNKFKSLVLILIFILSFSSLSGCINSENKENNPGRDSVIIGIMDNIYGFQPWLESYDSNTMNINMNIFNSLVAFDQIFRTKPKLATSWNNPNNVTWRFYLRENVKFHNGYPFTSEDVKYTIDFIKGNETHVLRDLLITIKEVKIVDKYTVDIITEEPCPVLLNKLIDIPIVSKKYQEETTKRWPIGTGAYKLIEYVQDEYIKLESFDGYWDQPLDVKYVKFKIIKDEEEMKNASVSGEIDIASHLLSMYYDEIVNCSRLTVGRCVQPTVMYLGFDFRENNSAGFKDEKNPLSDVRVRKAIYQTINISYIIDNVLSGSEFAEPASQFVSPLIFGYNPNIERLPCDPESAKELMKEAGYENGFDLQLDCIKGIYNQERICEIVQSQLSDIINVTINFWSIEDHYMMMINRNTSFYFCGWLTGTGDGGEVYDYILRTVDQEKGIGTYNIGYYSNPEVDSIGENISHILDPNERLSLMQEGFRIAMEDVAWIPLYTPKCVVAIADYIAWAPRADFMIKVEEISFK
jgi:peptide/nickel transport system substrate-binding protein